MHSTKFFLFCKSYKRDLLRASKLMSSVEAFNADNLTTFFSVPEEDFSLFRNKLGTTRCELLTDEDILRANRRIKDKDLRKYSGNQIQQVVKSEFWRLIDCNAYLCIDSDSEFIRRFYLSDFISSDGHPFTTLHQAKEYLQSCSNRSDQRSIQYFYRDSATGKRLFQRTGPDYDFGPTPVLWSPKVWKDLDQKFFEPRGWTIIDAINEFPAELRWYGEALLAFKSIALYPIEPLFRVYHSSHQYRALADFGETIDNLASNYLGVVTQSNWAYELDFGPARKSKISRFAQKLRQRIRGEST